MTRVLLTSVLVLLLGATGCGRYYWSRPGVTADQFDRDSQECVRHAGDTLGSNARTDAVEQVYRSCLQGRGDAREKQLEPPPAGSYRGIESDEEFAAVASGAGTGPRPGFEQQLGQLDDLGSRGARATGRSTWSSRGRGLEAGDLLE